MQEIIKNQEIFFEMLDELLPDKKIPRAQIARVVSSQTQDNHHGRKKLFDCIPRIWDDDIIQ